MKYIITFILSILITFTVGFTLPKTFNTIEELPTATFGFPLPIFFQQIRGYEKTIFPAKINFVSPWENPVYLHYGNLLIDIIFYWAVMLGVLRVVRCVRMNRTHIV